jgi:hypothetical protein
LEPISSWNRVRFRAAAAAIPRPTPSEPVKVTASTPGLSISVWPACAPEPMTRLKAPGGRSSWRLMISARAQALAGVAFAGFQTTALPKASAGAIFQAAVAMGKFQGEMTATTPMGSRRTSISMPGRTESAVSPICRRASAA